MLDRFAPGLAAATMLLVLGLASSSCRDGGGGHDHSHDGHSHDGHSHDGHSHDEHSHDGADSGDEGHVHVAPRGGTLIVLGEETFNAELILEADVGELTLYLLDAHAENPVRVEQATIELVVQIGGAEQTLTLAAQASALTGEEVGDSSEFRVRADALRGVEGLSGRISHVNALGAEWVDIQFVHP